MFGYSVNEPVSILL